MNRIIRVKSEKGFTIINNSVFTSGLSLKAIGLLSYILHLPSDWVIIKTQLYKTMAGDGRSSIDSAWKELSDAGFIHQKQERAKSGNLPVVNYYVLDYPQKDADFMHAGFMHADSTQRKTSVRKTRQLLNTIILNTNEQNTIIQNTVNTDLVPIGTSDPSPTVNLELEEKKGKAGSRQQIPDDSAEMKAEHKRYETEIYPEALKLDAVARKIKIAEYIREKKPAFYEPYKDLWNASAPANGLAKILKLSESRMKQFKTRLKDPDFDFIAVMMAIKKSQFLRGDNPRGWRVNWEYIFKNDTNYLKILEGTF